MAIRVYSAAGPLAGFRDGYRTWLASLGFAEATLKQLMVVCNQLNRYMVEFGIELSGLDEQVISQFVAARIEEGYAQGLTCSFYARLLEYLRGLGVCPAAPQAVALGGVEAVLAGWRDYLLSVKAMTPASVRGYLDPVRPLVAGTEADGAVDLNAIGQVQINEFILECRLGNAPKTVARTATALRSLLAYAFVKGLTVQDMSVAVPGAACPSIGLPRFLAMTDVTAMLESCDTARVIGLRDRAILLVLARLGLRAGEAARLRLDEINWRAGLITVVGKGGKNAQLPLPVDVGQALTDYLRQRPATAQGRTVFVRGKAPHQAMTSGGITQVVATASRRAGLGTLYAHRLRHTAASTMLAGGAGLPEVGQVLRHASLLTTANYARVDIAALRPLARAWNGARG